MPSFCVLTSLPVFLDSFHSHIIELMHIGGTELRVSQRYVQDLGGEEKSGTYNEGKTKCQRRNIEEQQKI